MGNSIDRRTFLRATTAGALASALPRCALAGAPVPHFEISLVESSFARSFAEHSFAHLDFARIARNELEISAVEYVSSFFGMPLPDDKVLESMNKRAAEHEVRQLLVMLDDQGRIAAAEARQRQRALQNHRRWVEVARSLGCHSIQIDPTSHGDAAEQQKRAVDGAAALCEYAGQLKINVLLGNYGGVSADAQWVAGVVNAVALPCCGVLPQLGPLKADRDYNDLAGLAPLARGITLRTSAFDDSGQETSIDVPRALQTILTAGYRGYIGIHYDGKTLDEMQGIRATKRLLEQFRMEA